jgi:hypothetical protein
MRRQLAAPAAVAQPPKLLRKAEAALLVGSLLLADRLPAAGLHQRQQAAGAAKPVHRLLRLLVAQAVSCHADPVARALKQNSQPVLVGPYFPRWPEVANARRLVATEMASALIGIPLMAGRPV